MTAATAAPALASVPVESNHQRLAKLLVPFPPEAIGQLPKAGVMLAYVGHAAITKRLLEVDPEWSWEPLALDEQGLPRFTKPDPKTLGLWIKLTVCGVTRLGYGDGPDPKQCIGDALRNAGMRFGLALDLWTKQDISDTTAAAAAVEPEVDPLRVAVKEAAADATDATREAWSEWWAASGLRWSSLTDNDRLAIKGWWVAQPPNEVPA